MKGGGGNCPGPDTEFFRQKTDNTKIKLFICISCTIGWLIYCFSVLNQLILLTILTIQRFC